MTFIKPLLVSFSLLACAALSAHAADDKKSFTTLDTNKDGAIARAEIAAHADLAARFKHADKNGDGKLSRSEYDAMAAGGAAAGGSMKKGDKK